MGKFNYMASKSASATFSRMHLMDIFKLVSDEQQFL